MNESPNISEIHEVSVGVPCLFQPVLEWPHPLWQPFTEDLLYPSDSPLPAFFSLTIPHWVHTGGPGTQPSSWICCFLNEENKLMQLLWKEVTPREGGAHAVLAKVCESVVPRWTHQKGIHSPDNASPVHESPFQQHLYRHYLTQCFRSLFYYGHHLLILSPLYTDNVMPHGSGDTIRNNTLLSLQMALLNSNRINSSHCSAFTQTEAAKEIEVCIGPGWTGSH